MLVPRASWDHVPDRDASMSNIFAHSTSRRRVIFEGHMARCPPLPIKSQTSKRIHMLTGLEVRWNPGWRSE